MLGPLECCRTEGTKKNLDRQAVAEIQRRIGGAGLMSKVTEPGGQAEAGRAQMKPAHQEAFPPEGSRTGGRCPVGRKRL